MTIIMLVSRKYCQWKYLDNNQFNTEKALQIYPISTTINEVNIFRLNIFLYLSYIFSICLQYSMIILFKFNKQFHTKQNENPIKLWELKWKLLFFCSFSFNRSYFALVWKKRNMCDKKVAKFFSLLFTY